jgi:hypothetical protein
MSNHPKDPPSFWLISREIRHQEKTSHQSAENTANLTKPRHHGKFQFNHSP